nr:MAG TPA: hypothetical protein [Caudoviricetes sp.]
MSRQVLRCSHLSHSVSFSLYFLGLYSLKSLHL